MIAIHPDKAEMTWDRLRQRLKKVQQGLPTPCWEFQGAKDQDGYGKIRVGDEIERAHRLSFMCKHGPIESGMVVRHKCDNPPCCNPEHLFLGTNEDNLKDMARKGRAQRWNAAKTHCPRGHAYDEENTYVKKRGGVPYGRGCKTCERARHRRRHAQAVLRSR